jgi:hypothetical protein
MTSTKHNKRVPIYYISKNKVNGEAREGALGYNFSLLTKYSKKKDPFYEKERI